MLMPASRAARGDANAHRLRRRGVSRPELGGKTPARMFMNVDLPAPLAPTDRVDLPGVGHEVDLIERARCRGSA